MAIVTMQMRRGQRKDFDPERMLPGEWAVAIDAETQNQIVWMAFAPGVVKRMGTYEDFAAQIAEATSEVLNQYIEQLTAAANELQGNTETYIQGKVDDEWVPALQALVDDAAQSANSALDSAAEAAISAQGAAASAAQAAASETAAGASAEQAAASETAAEDWSKWSESYAHGKTGVREGEDTDSSEYYYLQTLHLAQGFNGLIPMGNATFEQLATVEKQSGYMYNVTDAFTSDETFNDGGGVYYGPGNNVVWTALEKWDVLAASAVTGIKGNAEDHYQQNNYDITPDKIKLKDDFEAAVKQAHIEPGDTLSVAFSKLAKYCETIESNEKKTPIFGSYDTFPKPGETGRLYVDDTQDPRLIFTWDAEAEDYVLTGGAGGDGASSNDVPVTLPASGWTGESSPYQQTITVPQAREGMTPLHFAGEGDDEMLYAYSLIKDYTCGNASMTFYASEKPAVDIHLVLKGLPTQEVQYADNSVIVPVTADLFVLNDTQTRYEQTLSVPGMTEGLGGTWDILRSAANITEEESAIALNITDVERLTDAIKVSCLEKPSRDFMLILFGTWVQASDGTALVTELPEWFGRVETLESGLIQTNKNVENATSKSWQVTINVGDWASATDSFAGVSTSFKATKTLTGVTADTNITNVVFTGGSREAAATWAFLRPGAGRVEFCSETKPAAAFSLELVEVR